MHAKGHRQSYQLDTAPYFLLGMGMEDGEACERLFSELRRFLSHTTTMRIENRQDSICLLLEGRARIKLDSIVAKFKLEVSKAVKLFDNFTPLGYDATLNLLRNYLEKRKQSIISPDSMDLADLYDSILEIARNVDANIIQMRSGHAGTQYVTRLSKTNKTLNVMNMTCT